MQIRALFSLCFLVLAGCSTVPDSVQLPDETQLVSYEEVTAKPEVQGNKLARWGGVIAGVQNQQEQTLLDIVYYPLRAYGRPILRKESIGRFRVYVNSFLDPMVYLQGRSVTFAGEIAGFEEGKVGEHTYRYPVMKASGYHLWEDIDRVEIDTISVWPMFPGPFIHPWGARGFWGWNQWPMQRHIVTRRRSNPYRNFAPQAPQQNPQTSEPDKTAEATVSPAKPAKQENGQGNPLP